MLTPMAPLNTVDTAPHSDPLGQRLTIWNSAEPFTEGYALRTYSLQQLLRGCKVLSPSASVVVQQNFTGLPAQLRGPAAIALSKGLLADTRATGRAYNGGEERYVWAPSCAGKSRPVLAEEGSDEVWVTDEMHGFPCSASSLLLPIQVAQGGSVSYTARRAALLGCPAVPR